ISSENTILAMLNKTGVQADFIAEKSHFTYTKTPTGPAWIIDPLDVRKKPAKVMAAFKAVLIRVQGIRRAGAVALDLAYVACGRMDGFWEIKLKPWDTAAGQLILEEAGGKTSDFSGNAYSPFVPEILATNGLIHKELLSIFIDML
nr:hypothetical protein [Deltaproteobacteria bacterium]